MKDAKSKAVALILGGSSGMGRATAKLLLKREVDVVLVAVGHTRTVVAAIRLAVAVGVVP